MIDFPITQLFDDSLCLLWLERHLYPDGFVCPQCGSANRRHFRTHGYYDAYRCRACEHYYTLLSGTAFLAAASARSRWSSCSAASPRASRPRAWPANSSSRVKPCIPCGNRFTPI